MSTGWDRCVNCCWRSSQGATAGQDQQGGATWFLGLPAFEVAGEQKEVKLTNQTHVAWNGGTTEKDRLWSRLIKYSPCCAVQCSKPRVIIKIKNGWPETRRGCSARVNSTQVLKSSRYN